MTCLNSPQYVHNYQDNERMLGNSQIDALSELESTLDVAINDMINRDAHDSPFVIELLDTRDAVHTVLSMIYIQMSTTKPRKISRGLTF